MCKHGTLAPGATTITVERAPSLLVVRGVPADVCDNCGEEYLSADVAAALEHTAAAMPAGVRVQVLDWA